MGNFKLFQIFMEKFTYSHQKYLGWDKPFHFWNYVTFTLKLALTRENNIKTICNRSELYLIKPLLNFPQCCFIQFCKKNNYVKYLKAQYWNWNKIFICIRCIDQDFILKKVNLLWHSWGRPVQLIRIYANKINIFHFHLYLSL